MLETLKDSVALIDVALPIPEEKPAHKKIKLGPKHREHLAWLNGKGYGDWDDHANGINTHTCHVAEMHEHFELDGDFTTTATGKDGPKGRNCIIFPKERGTWLCVKYGGGENGPGWRDNPKGHATCLVGKTAPNSKPDPADMIVTDAIKKDTFFHNEGVAYVAVQRKGKIENLMVESSTYARLLRVRYRTAHHQVCKGDWIKNSVDQLVAMAIEENDEICVYSRQAYIDGVLYIDLADPNGNIVAIDGEGYKIVQTAPVRFLRTEKMRPLPLPQEGGNLHDLTKYINVTKSDFPLLVGAVLGCYHPAGPYPVIHFIGGDGRCKTSAATFMLMLVDPSIIKGCSPPETNEDLILSVQQRWVYFIDNLSEIKAWLSDSLCRLATGGATERRTKYRDRETSVFRAKRPTIITSIVDVVKNPDLVSRTIKLELPRVTDRKSEVILWQDFKENRPKILGAIYTALSKAIKNLPNTHISNLPRLADWCLWCQAAEEGTNLKRGVIVQTYRDALQAEISEVLCSDTAQLIIGIATETEWKGTGKELADKVNLPYTRDREIQDFLKEMRTLQTSLESAGVLIGFRKSHGKKLITIQKIKMSI